MITDKGYPYGYVEHPCTIRRQADFPVDESSVFNTFSEAEEYVTNNPIAYDTQIIGIKETGDLYQVKDNTLIPLQTSSISEIKYCFGYWTIINLINDISGRFDMDLLYPINADKYQIFIKDTPVSEIQNFDEEFVTAPILFKEKGADMYLILYKSIFDTELNTYTNKELIKLNIVPTYSNNAIICGMLSAYNS